MIYDLKINMSISLYWEHNESFKDATYDVSVEYKVMMINVIVKFTWV